jgi:hypothetical protein
MKTSWPCEWTTGTVTGPDGASVTHSGSATRVAPGVVTTAGDTTVVHGWHSHGKRLSGVKSL